MKKKTIYWIVGIVLFLLIANEIFFASMFKTDPNTPTLEIG
jgi:hypothetical protein